MKSPKWNLRWTRSFFLGVTSEFMFHHFSIWTPPNLQLHFPACAVRSTADQEEPERLEKDSAKVRTRPNLVVMLVMLDGWVMIRLISFGDYTTCYHIIYIYYIIHSNNDNNDDHIMMVINNNNKVIYIYTYEYIGDYHSPGNHALDQPVDCGMTEVPNTQPGSSWPACDGGPCSIMQPFPTTKLLIKPQFLHWLPDPVARWIMGRNTGLTNKHYVMDIFFWLVNHWITIKVLSRFWHHPGGFGECWMDLDGL